MFRAAILAFVFLLALPVALEAAPKPKPHVPTSLILNQNAPIYHGDTITFSWSVGAVKPPYKNAQCTELGECPAIQVLCTQNGDFTQPIYADIQPAWNASFYLESGTYPDGTPFWNPVLAAQCRAILFDYRNDPSHWARVFFEALP